MRLLKFWIILSLLLAQAVFSLPPSTAFSGIFDSYPANVTGLTLDRTVLRGKTQSRLVKVWTLAEDPLGDLLVFNFTVSGGKILNAKLYPGKEYQTFAISGEKLDLARFEVIWDLSDVLPGKYSITAGVDDGCGLCGQTQTQTVLVDPISDEGVLPCPSTFRVAWNRPFFRVAWNRPVVRRSPIRLLAVPVSGQLYEMLPPQRWNLPANAILAGDGSPMIDIVLDRKQDSVKGSFVRDPGYLSSTCSFAAEFSAQIFKTERK